MSYSQAMDAQLALLRSYTRGAGVLMLRQLFEQCSEEGRIGLMGGGPSYDFNEYVATVLVGLDGGTPIYWSPEMCGLLEGVAPSMPEWTMRAEAVPDRRGFIWFSAPLTLPAWPTVGRRDLLGLGFSALTSHLVVSFWMVDHEQQPWPGAAMTWKYGSSWKTMLEQPELAGLTIENQGRQTAIGRYMAAAFALMEQRILVTRPERPSRATRKRAAEVWTHDPVVRVVSLRRLAHARGTDEVAPEPVAWSCQWVVRGHWRQQACGPQLTERRPVFVLPHLKGDPDKPLKVADERVFAVVR